MAEKSILGNNLPDSLVDAATGIVSQNNDDRQAVDIAVLAEFGARSVDELSANDKSRYDRRIFDIKRGAETLLNEEPVDDVDEISVIGKEKKNGKKKNGNGNDDQVDEDYEEDEDEEDEEEEEEEEKSVKEATTSDTLLFKGDKVHLGTGSKGGAGVEGKVIKFDRHEVTIESPDGKTYKGPRKFLTKEQVSGDLNHIIEATKAQVEKVFKAGLKKFKAKSPADLSTADKKKLFNWVDSQLKAKNESLDLDEATPKIKYAKIVKGLRDSQGPFTVVAMKAGKVVDQKATIKSKALLPIEVNQMVMDNPAATVAIESKAGKVLNTFRL